MERISPRKQQRLVRLLVGVGKKQLMDRSHGWITVVFLVHALLQCFEREGIVDCGKTDFGCRGELAERSVQKKIWYLVLLFIYILCLF